MDDYGEPIFAMRHLAKHEEAVFPTKEFGMTSELHSSPLQMLTRAPRDLFDFLSDDDRHAMYALDRRSRVLQPILLPIYEAEEDALLPILIQARAFLLGEDGDLYVGPEPIARADYLAHRLLFRGELRIRRWVQSRKTLSSQLALLYKEIKDQIIERERFEVALLSPAGEFAGRTHSADCFPGLFNRMRHTRQKQYQAELSGINDEVPNLGQSSQGEEG